MYGLELLVLLKKHVCHDISGKIAMIIVNILDSSNTNCINSG